MGVDESAWELMRVDESAWELMRVHGSAWELMRVGGQTKARVATLIHFHPRLIRPLKGMSNKNEVCSI